MQRETAWTGFFYIPAEMPEHHVRAQNHSASVPEGFSLPMPGWQDGYVKARNEDETNRKNMQFKESSPDDLGASACGKYSLSPHYDSFERGRTAGRDSRTI
jgi:hypothetical protein